MASFTFPKIMKNHPVKKWIVLGGNLVPTLSPTTSALWTPWPIALPTLGTIIGIWRVIGSKPGAVLLILK